MYKLISIVMLMLMTSWSYANDIYVTQSGASLDLDITQDGENNTEKRNIYNIYQEFKDFYDLCYDNFKIEGLDISNIQTKYNSLKNEQLLKHQSISKGEILKNGFASPKEVARVSRGEIFEKLKRQ